MSDTDYFTTIDRKVEDILGKLDALGTPDHIAMHLGDLGIKAQPGFSSQCAIAVMIRNEVGDLERVRVESEYCFVGTTTHELPAAVEEFVCAYDQHKYPELVLPVSEYAPCDCGCEPLS